ncbi:SMI1 / KNR4 [Photobacterium marinum]|nr:SMI1 / KNR4 [Photobacterium marinum]
MSILDRINPCFRIDANEPAANENELQMLKRFSAIDIPADYLSVVGEMTEVEIFVDGGNYFRIWSPSGCIEMNEEYMVQDYIPNSLAIGDDEGGSALIIMTGNKGYGLYKVGFGDLDVDDAEYISASLSELLIDGFGAQVI